MATPAAAPAASTKPANIGPDGETITDMAYYDVLGVRGDASDADIKKAYRKLAIRYHPDKADPNDAEAKAKFLEIGEAYQVLSDSNLRAAYNKKGKKDAASPEGGFADAGEMFAGMFGGERFKSWVGEIALGKEFERVSETMMTPEEKAELEKEAAAKSAAPAQPSASPAASPRPDATVPSTATTTSSADGLSSIDKLHLGEPSTSAASTSTGSELHKHDSATAAASSSKPSKPGKLTPEQRKQLEALDELKAKERAERVSMLVRELLDRIRPFVHATKPGDPADAETQAFEKRMRLEAEDLKLESFGIELCHLIGSIYISKATTYLRLHKKGAWSNPLGLGKWWSGVKEKGQGLKEGFGFLSATLDVQSAMEEAAKKAESGEGEAADEEALARDSDLMGKILLVSWKGTKWEVAGVLREVISAVLTHRPPPSLSLPTPTDDELTNRANALLLIGAIFSSVKADEADDERRELERLVAAAAAKKKGGKKAKGGKDTSPAVTPAAGAAPSTA